MVCATVHDVWWVTAARLTLKHLFKVLFLCMWLQKGTGVLLLNRHGLIKAQS